MTDFQGAFYRDVQPFSGGWAFLLGDLPGSLPAPRTRQTLPRSTVGVGRVQNGAHGHKTRRHLLCQHTIPSLDILAGAARRIFVILQMFA